MTRTPKERVERGAFEHLKAKLAGPLRHSIRPIIPSRQLLHERMHQTDRFRDEIEVPTRRTARHPRPSRVPCRPMPPFLFRSHR